MVVMNFAIATAISVTVFTGGASRWPGYPLLGDLTVDFLLYELRWRMLAALWLPIAAAPAAAAKGRRRQSRWLKWPLWGVVGGAMLATLAAGGLMVFTLVAPHAGSLMWWKLPTWILGAVYGYLPLSSTSPPAWPRSGSSPSASAPLVRSFIVEYVGDVAIYVASHKLDRFYETRKAIKASRCESPRPSPVWQVHAPTSASATR